MLMRLLIGSDSPAYLGKQTDVRAWTQRVLWFAEEGDAIVLMDTPDREFVEHVTRLKGLDPSKLRFHNMPSKRIGGNFDAWSLLDPGFQDALIADALTATEVIALWPCSEVGWLVKSLEIDHKLSGAAFWREGGGILANSKSVFRALAAGANIPIPLGGVCRSREDAFRLSGHLLHKGCAFIVKQSYAGGGAGNEIVSTQQLSVSHAGHASAKTIESNSESLHAYWDSRWQWASQNGAHPVVVEEFVPDARTLYVEVVCDDDGVGTGKIGELKFEGGQIVQEIFPAQDVPSSVLEQLRNAADRLAPVYLAAGYRGHLSLDSVVTSNDRVLFTEANARFTGSTHIYEQIATNIARFTKVPERVVVQMLSPPSWQLQNFAEFLEILFRHGLSFDPALRRGVLAITPVVYGSGQLVLAAVAEHQEAAIELVDSVHHAIKQSRVRAKPL